MKICSKCRKKYEIKFFHKDSKSKDGLFAYCKKCSWQVTSQWRKKNPDKVSANRKSYYERNKESLIKKIREREKKNPEVKSLRRKWQRNWKLKQYGITKEIFEKILEKQNLRCAICKKLFEDKMPNIDHCHKTGKVRGLLCGECNISLGHFEKVQQRAIVYLREVERREIESSR